MKLEQARIETFPQPAFKEVPASAVPQAIFDSHEVCRPEDVERAYVVSNGEHTTYLIEANVGSPQAAIRMLYVADMMGSEYVGRTTVEITIPSEGTPRSEVGFASEGYSDTRERWQGTGLGTGRLKLANQFVQTRLNRVLYSSPTHQDASHRAWQKLIREGAAERTPPWASLTHPYRFRKNAV